MTTCTPQPRHTYPAGFAQWRRSCRWVRQLAARTIQCRIRGSAAWSRVGSPVGSVPGIVPPGGARRTNPSACSVLNRRPARWCASMAGTPGGEYVVLSAADGSVYLYDALADDFVQSKLYTSFAQSTGMGLLRPGYGGAQRPILCGQQPDIEPSPDLDEPAYNRNYQPPHRCRYAHERDHFRALHAAGPRQRDGGPNGRRSNRNCRCNHRRNHPHRGANAGRSASCSYYHRPGNRSDGPYHGYRLFGHQCVLVDHQRPQHHPAYSSSGLGPPSG